MNQILTTTKPKVKRLKQKKILKNIQKQLDRQNVDPLRSDNYLNFHSTCINPKINSIYAKDINFHQDSSSIDEDQDIKYGMLTRRFIQQQVKLNLSGAIFYKVLPSLTSQVLPYKPLEQFEYAILFQSAHSIGFSLFIKNLCEDFTFLKSQFSNQSFDEQQLNKIQLKIDNQTRTLQINSQDRYIVLKAEEYLKIMIIGYRMLFDEEGYAFYQYTMFLKWQRYPNGYVMHLKDQPRSDWLYQCCVPLISKIM
ncbi:hypothetical protein SS50377_27990 [Spironucleus salmonicida]|uniref:Uncharacterized protein n=1 Tax=Spironucleus salmonicida TaxID=348837 RepID=V6LDI7_9EUKA|nr:hypothetical protein SS50377_27990 [Spironucleus salmonicida]|eukprot:EST42547.1 Hypothetical protein SS50377_17861 [Spironucleus salmonicida]